MAQPAAGMDAGVGALGGPRDKAWYARHCANVDADRDTVAFRTECTVRAFQYLGPLPRGARLYYGLYDTLQFWRRESEAARSVPAHELDLPMRHVALTLFVGRADSPQVEPVYFFEEEWIDRPVLRGRRGQPVVRFLTGNGNKVRYTVSVKPDGGRWAGTDE